MTITIAAKFVPLKTLALTVGVGAAVLEGMITKLVIRVDKMAFFFRFPAETNVIKKRTLLTLIFSAACLSGCASTLTKETDASNLKDRLSAISLLPFVFFNAKNESKKPGCFPPSTKPICEEAPDQTYRPTKQLKMEEISFSISHRNGSFAHSAVKELGYLVAAEVALQRGHSKFIINRMGQVSACIDHVYADTEGRAVGNNYSSTTTFSEGSTCVGSLTMNALIFDDYDDVKLGVFYRPSSDAASPVKLLRSLYFTSYEFAGMSRDQMNYNRDNPREAWKAYHDAAQLAEALRQKYNTAPKTDYEIKLEVGPNGTKSIIDEYKRSN